MLTDLINHIKKFVLIENNDVKTLEEYLTPIKVNKKEILLKEGQICEANYFVIKGCLRLYLLLEDGNEHIIQFAINNWWITDYNSLESSMPSKFFIQAVENTEIILIEKNIREELFKKIPSFERYFRIILQKAYSASLMRIHYQLDYSGEERYLHFKKLYPDFVQRIPQYMLASYLGFTPEFLSKIRGKKD